MLNIVSSETIKKQQYNPSSPISATKVPAHNVFVIDQVIFSSNFDNGNLARVEKIPNRSYEYKIWTAPDNMVNFFSFLIVHQKFSKFYHRERITNLSTVHGFISL